MLVGALCIPRFPLACELAERPELRLRPALVARRDEGRVWTVSKEAEAYGLASEQRLREALGHFPDVAVVEGRPALYQAIAEGVLEALLRTVPEIELGPEGVWFIVLNGLRACFGTLPNLTHALLSCAPPALEPRLGIASGKFAALVAAQAAAPGRYRYIQPERTAEFLGPQPINVLPLSSEGLRRMKLIGIHNLEVLRALPRSALAAQLGPEGARGWDLANGEDPSPIRPKRRLESIVERFRFDPPLMSREVVLKALEQELGQALGHPPLKDCALRQVMLRAETEGGACWERTITFKEALAERDRIWTALQAVVERAEFPGPVAELRLELGELTHEPGRQLQFPTAQNRQRERLDGAMRQLKARYGYCPVGRVVEVEPWSRLPERRLALIDYAL